jgi:hypothetical protein
MTNSPPPTTMTTVFFHVMKCGGTSVRAGLATSLTGEREGPEVYELDGQAAARAAGGTNHDNWRFRDALLPFVIATMRPTLVLGHFRYRDRYEELLAGVNLVTVLRNPLDRFVSLYRYRRYKEGVHESVSMPFGEFVASPRWAKEGHLYVDTFCGREGIDPRCDEAVSATVANLRRFAVVGRTEQLDDFAGKVAACVGRAVSIPVRNTGPVPTTAPARGSDIDDELIAKARAVCEPDQLVYDAIFGESRGSR